MSKNIEIVESGKAGKIIYNEGVYKHEFDYEFGGGECLVLIWVPSEKEWANETQLNLEQRPQILEFIAHQIIFTKAKGCSFRITENNIAIISPVKPNK